MKKLLFVFIVLLALCSSVFAIRTSGPYDFSEALIGENSTVERVEDSRVIVTGFSHTLGYLPFDVSKIKSLIVTESGDWAPPFNTVSGVTATPTVIPDTDTLYIDLHWTDKTKMNTLNGIFVVFKTENGNFIELQGITMLMPLVLVEPGEEIYPIKQDENADFEASDKPYKISFVPALSTFSGNIFDPKFEVEGTGVTVEVDNTRQVAEASIPAKLTVSEGGSATVTVKLWSDSITAPGWRYYKYYINKNEGSLVILKDGELIDNYVIANDESIDLTADFDGIGDPVYTWKSDNTDFVKVVGDGANATVTEVMPNPYNQSANITVTATVGEKTYSAKVFITSSALPVQSIKITKEDGTVPTKVKNTQDVQFVATVLPAGVDQDVIWSSSDENILKVSETGVVSAISNGTATITATSVADPSVSADVEIISFISINDVKLYYKGTDTEAPESIVLTPGNSASFEVRFNPTNPTEKTMKWKNMNNNVADITSADQYFNDVTITAITGGKTQFSYVAKNGMGSGLTVYVPWFKVNNPTINVKIEKGPVKSNVVLYPDALRETENVEYVIEDPTIIKIDKNGNITGLKKGTTTFYAKACGIESEKVTVNVSSDSVEDITFTDRKLFLHPKDNYTFNVIFTPSDATDKRLTWKVSNKSVLSIKNGKIVALANGFSKVEARSVDGNKVAVCDVYVTDKVSDFKLSKTSVTLGVGETAKITASFKPKEISGTLEWFVGDDTVASIDTKTTVCNITGVGLGNTKVYAKVDGVTLECVVTVEEPEE